MIQIRRISPETDAELYAQECALREDVLLRSVGLTMETFRRHFPYEDLFEHYVAVFDHPNGATVVGCATLLPEADGRAKLMQMAVHPQRQGEGIGRKLVAAIERRALGELGIRELYCHAQEQACGFYAQLGWQVDSDVFEEVGIRHRRMSVRAPDPAEEEDLLLH